MSQYVKHPTARVYASQVGVSTRIGAGSEVQSGASVAEWCEIGNYCVVEAEVTVHKLARIGDGVTVPRRVEIGEGAVLGAHVAFERGALGPHEAPPPTLIGEGARIGANATIRCGVSVGAHALVAAGSVVLEDVPAHAAVESPSARLSGWVCACGAALDLPVEGKAEATCPCGRAYGLAGGEITEYVRTGVR